jgi:hypothetical protein
MPVNYKTYVLVTLVALVVFTIGKPLFTRFMTAEDFARRRNLWLWLSATSFLAPSMWLYLLLAAPAILFASRRDPNPLAMYFFVLLAVPPVRVDIPTFGLIGKVFAMDHPRLLSLALLLPLALRLGSERSRWGEPEAGAGVDNPTKAVDLLLLGYLALQVALLLPYDSATSLVRRVLLLGIDIALPYFVVSRACRSRAMIADAMASFVTAMAVLVPLAVVEFVRGWMLFAIIGEQWDAARLYFPLHRGSFLRAQTTAGHSIFFGYFMAMALGMWLYLQGRGAVGAGWRWLCGITLMGGLIVALARGPWVGAVAIVLVYLALGPNASSRTIKGISAIAAVAGIALVSPWGDSIIDFLPFIGTVDEHTVTYRQQLAAGSWLLIQQNPLLGSPFFLQSMEEFRTGEGIIDLVNTYAIVALSFGMVGLSLFVGVFLLVAWKAFRVVRRLAPFDPDASVMGATMIACIAGTLVVLATTSFLHSMPYMAWAFVGLTAAYVRLETELSPETLISATTRGEIPQHALR